MNLITNNGNATQLDIAELAKALGRPALYERSDNYIWTEPHVSSEMLNFHLDPDRDLASHRHSTIDAQVAWITAKATGSGGSDSGTGSPAGEPAGKTLLDIGCGPGLYCERFAQAGFAVAGMDINAHSLAYARAHAAETGLQIDYALANYVDLDVEAGYDVIVLINRDFNALIPSERDRVVAAVGRALKPGGLFVFDASTTEFFRKHGEYRTFQANTDAGFWSDGPHLVLEEHIAYPDALDGPTVLERQIVIEADGTVKEFRNWLTCYTEDTLRRLVERVGFEVIDSNQYLCDDAYEEKGLSLGLVTQKK